MSIFPVNTPPPVSNLYSHGSVIVDGVSLDASYNSTPSTHVLVGAFASGSAKSSWLGWAMTDYPVTQQDREATAQRLGRELLASVNSEVLCVGATEELRRRHREAGAAEAAAAEAAARKSDRELAAHEGGIQVGLGMALPLLEAVIDRIEPGMTDKAHEPARRRAADMPPMSPGAHTASLIKTLQDTVGARGAEVAVMHLEGDTLTMATRRLPTVWDRVKDAVASEGLQIVITDLPADDRPVKFEVRNPRVYYSGQDAPATDKLFESAVTRVELIRLLRAAQAERDALVHKGVRMQAEINSLVGRVQTLTEEGRSMVTMARETLTAEGIEDPSTRILRARLLLDHAKAAHDLGHGFTEMLELDTDNLAGLDVAEDIARKAYKNALLDLAAEEDDARDFNSEHG